MTNLTAIRAAPALVALALLSAACGGGGDPAPGDATPGVAAAATPAGPAITVYKTPTCGCCRKWVDHLQAAGFRVETVDQEDLTAVKQEHGVPKALQSCHTAVVDGYAVEGHVPADLIRKLLAERPAVKGLAVPGMPMGSPGMEGPYKDPYEVYTFDASGPGEVYAVR